MEVTQDLSFVHLISNASVLVQLVMGLLLLVSLLSWWYIFIKLFAIRREKRLTSEFEELFWRNSNLNDLYKQSSGAARADQGALERIFAAGFVEFVKLKKQHGMDSSAVMDGTRRAMRATYQRE
ncbi:MAG: protein TolQ, partial [Gallionellales bacterium CG_4_9_14_0_8_um_filter_55_61]